MLVSDAAMIPAGAYLTSPLGGRALLVLSCRTTNLTWECKRCEPRPSLCCGPLIQECAPEDNSLPTPRVEAAAEAETHRSGGDL